AANGSPIAEDGASGGEGGGGWVLVLRDMTMQLRTEEQLRKASRLESLGVLAGGIAHDFNNVLMGIQSNVAFARTKGVRRADQREALEDVEAAVRHGRDLTQQLLTFSRGGSPVKSNASLGELVEEVSGFALRGSSVRSVIDIAPRLSVTQVDRSQICQVVENLLVNAHQAMPEGGTVRIEVQDEVVGRETSLSVPAGRYVRMTFEDDGPGISETDLPRIFDPFFSGRPGGTGLGLSIVHSIVKRHGGGVQVHSKLGKGTRFDVYLPAMEHGTTEAKVAGSAPRRGCERILLMDDDAAIRRSMQRLLTQLGYRVDAVPHGSEAVRAYREAMTTEPYAVTILDLTVAGGLGGKVTAQNLRKIDPRARIVVSSGYSDDGVMA
ncbi:MAG: ATP-binding protein, partial [Coriobacteriia bacterium]|nr:ATP-binding protein [Coriobacteriia bacterium]